MTIKSESISAATREIEFDEVNFDNQSDNAKAPSESELNKAWFLFWMTTWLGTSVAGACFGVLYSLFALGDGAVSWLSAMLGCFALGFFWAGVVGMVIMPHLALFKWMFWIKGPSPMALAAIAGGVTGLITFFPPLTVPMGAVGALIFANKFLEGPIGKPILSLIHI